LTFANDIKDSAYDDSMYTTKLDLSKLTPEQIMLAERIEKEVMTKQKAHQGRRTMPHKHEHEDEVFDYDGDDIEGDAEGDRYKGGANTVDEAEDEENNEAFDVDVTSMEDLSIAALSESTATNGVSKGFANATDDVFEEFDTADANLAFDGVEEEEDNEAFDIDDSSMKLDSIAALSANTAAADFDDTTSGDRPFSFGAIGSRNVFGNSVSRSMDVAADVGEGASGSRWSIFDGIDRGDSSSSNSNLFGYTRSGASQGFDLTESVASSSLSGMKAAFTNSASVRPPPGFEFNFAFGESAFNTRDDGGGNEEHLKTTLVDFLFNESDEEEDMVEAHVPVVDGDEHLNAKEDDPSSEWMPRFRKYKDAREIGDST
jgi:hypothetical protein